MPSGFLSSAMWRDNDYIDAVATQKRIEQGMKKVTVMETLIDALHILSPIHNHNGSRPTMHVSYKIYCGVTI